MQLQPAIPVFRIFDYAMAKKFYVDWLGFKIDWEYQNDPKAPRYLQVSRDGAVLQLSEHFGDCCPGAKAVVNIDDIEGFHREIQSRPNPNMNPGLETEPWGVRSVEVIDPFGNRLYFCQPLEKKR